MGIAARFFLAKAAVLLMTLLMVVADLPAETGIKETGIPFIRHYSKRDYKGGTQNWDFVQAANHTLYIANNQGVIVFDGVEWELIPLPNGSVVRSLYQDEHGRIYAGGFDEFGYIERDPDGGLRFISLTQKAGISGAGEVWRIATLGTRVYFQTYTALISWDRSTDEWFVTYPQNRFDFLHLVSGQLYINEIGIGLHRLQNNDLVLIPGGEFFADREVWDMLEHDQGLLICTQNEGAFVYNEGTPTPWESQVNRFLIDNRFYCSASLGPYYAWGSIRNGLIISDKNGRIIKHLDKEVGLQNNTVLSLFPDREGTLWLGLDNGLAQVLVNLPLSELKTSMDVGSGYAAALFEGRLYLGTNQGLFWVDDFFGAGVRNELLELKQVSELAGQVWSLQVCEDQLLVGHNLGTFSIRNNQVRMIGSDPGGWMLLPVPDRQDLFIGGSYYGLELYLKGDGDIRSLGKIEGFDESSRHMLFQNERILWMGHGYEGIFRIELNDSLTRVVKMDCYQDSSGLGTKSFNELLTVKPKVIVSNPRGYYVYDEKIQDFVPEEAWNRTFGSGARMTKLIQENDERFWYFQDGRAGLLRIINDTILLRDDQILAPLQGEFIPSFENIVFLREGDLVLGTDKGFVHLNPQRSVNYNLDYPVLFKSVTILKNDSLVRLHDTGLKKDSLMSLSVPYRFNDLRIHYVAPHLMYPDQTQYRYRLDRYAQGWSPWSDRHYAELIGLREGEYTLQVQARNAFGIVSREGELSLTVQTPWYRSLIAWISYFLLAIVAAFLSTYLIRSNLEREKRRTQLIEQRRMLHKQLKLKRDSELAEKEIVKLRNEKLRADIRHKSKELANQTMGIIQKNRFLTDIKDEMVRLKSQAQNEEVKTSMKKMIRKIDRNIEDEDTQKVFETNFDQVHENFLQRLREAFPELTAKDLRLCAFLRLNLTTKEIAPLLNISARGVEISRYRLRKKLQLDHKEHLTDFILRF